MNKIILALDNISNLQEAIDIAKKTKDKIYTLKLGLHFWHKFGKEGVKKFNEIGITNLMLDLKRRKFRFLLVFSTLVCMIMSLCRR